MGHRYGLETQFGSFRQTEAGASTGNYKGWPTPTAKKKPPERGGFN